MKSNCRLLFAGASVAVVLVLLSCPAPASANDLVPEIDKYISAHVELGNFSGSVLIAKNGEILFEKSYGLANYEFDVPNTTQTRFEIGSMAKPFTAMGIMMLQKQGLLKVSEPLTKFIPDYPSGEKITVHHLLTHTSGLPDLMSIPNIRELTKSKTPLETTIEKLKKQPMAFSPGTEYRYCNAGYVILGYVIEQVSGQSYGDFLRENIFEPLKMNNTGFNDPRTVVKNRAVGYTATQGEGNLANAEYEDLSSVRGSAGLYSTVEDLYRWDRALYTEQLVNEQTLDQIFTPSEGRRYGYGWVISQRFDHKMIWHDGTTTGFQSYIARFVDDDACLIVLSNFVHTPMPTIRKDLAAILFGEAYELPVAQEIAAVDPAIYDAYVGQYHLENEDTITITKDGEHLFGESLAAPTKFELFPKSDTEFFVKMKEGVGFTFRKNEKGTVEQLILHWGSHDIPGRKIE